MSKPSHILLTRTLVCSGFESTNRAAPLAQKIVENVIKLDIADSFYSPTNWAFLNDTRMPLDYNYMTPSVPVSVNGVRDATSQRFHVRQNCIEGES